MASWTTISSTLVVAGKPVTASLMGALRENDEYVAELAWHPYDMVTRDDGADGVIYDFAVDGTQSSVTSPDFVDGFEYRFEFYNLSSSATTCDAEIQFFRETSGSYSASRILKSFSSGTDSLHGAVELRRPRLSRDLFYWINATTMRNLNAQATTEAFDLGSAQKVLRARFLFSSGNVDGGTITMLKRRAV